MALCPRALPNSSRPMSFLKAAQSVQPLTVLPTIFWSKDTPLLASCLLNCECRVIYWLPPVLSAPSIEARRVQELTAAEQLG